MDIVARLLRSPLDYRHALGILDPEYQEWRPQGRPEYEIIFFGEAPLLMVEAEHAYQLLWEPVGRGPQDLVDYLEFHEVNILSVLGESCYRALEPLLGEGRWTVSRNYGVIRSQFRPRPSRCIRKLRPGDHAIFDSACAVHKALQSASIHRDFHFMKQGLPVECYGAFIGAQLVGFCSANPICRGVTEISTAAVAQEHRQQGLASGLLTAQAQEAFARGDAVAYYAGSAEDDLNAMLVRLRFQELMGDYRFVPASSPEPWQAWGCPPEKCYPSLLRVTCRLGALVS